jgi:DNA-directed RNA polymerase subunit RPC12/RpoP
VADDVKYLKGTCTVCSGHFEFSEAGPGETIACPHCQSEILLIKEESPAPTPVQKRIEDEFAEFKTSDGKFFAHFVKSANGHVIMSA